MTTSSLHRLLSPLKFISTMALSLTMVASFEHTAHATPFLNIGPNYPNILEDERIICSGSQAVGSLSIPDCKTVARDFYREIHFQITDFTGAGVLVIKPTSIEMSPDGGGFAKGLFESFPLFLGVTAGNPYSLSIGNAFAYQPIASDMVAFFGAPLFTNFNGVNFDQPVHINNIQLSIYRRIQGTLNDPTCRSVENPGGQLCWAIMAELWSYQTPLGFGMSSSSSQVTPLAQPNTFLRTNDFPDVLESGRIICDSQVADATTTDTAWLQTCNTVAREFYDEFHLDLRNYTGSGTFDIPASIEMIPDGSGYIGGVQTDNLYSQMTADHTKLLGIENAFAYKPVDANTVLVLGAPLITLSTNDSSIPSYLRNMQLSVYRRTEQGLHAPQTCRSSSHPNRNACWVLVNKLWIPQQALGSGVSFSN